MKISIKETREYDARWLKVKAKVRYWEDATVNGAPDTEEGAQIPCKDGDYWCPKINIDTGTIVNWKEGVTASIHYKVCDEGTYDITDHDGYIITRKNGHVPRIMSPEENGFGDYIIMEVLPNGFIKNWEINWSGFDVVLD